MRMLVPELRERVYKANMELPEHGLVKFTWGNVSAIDREKERENALMRAGWRLIRLRWEHVNGGNPKVLEQSLRNFGLI